jgi:RNA polymerase sigma factor (TIGR02999 family)
VHEAWLRLGADGQPRWRNRAHFFAVAAEAMRRILIETARRKHSQQRGGHWYRGELKETTPVLERPTDEILAVDEALTGLAGADPLAAELVKLRYLVDMSLPEAAEALGISARTADRLWAYARSRLH